MTAAKLDETRCHWEKERSSKRQFTAVVPINSAHVVRLSTHHLPTHPSALLSSFADLLLLVSAILLLELYVRADIMSRRFI